MAVQCSGCGRHYDVTLFAFGNRVRCECGHLVDGRQPQILRAEDMDRRRPSDIEARAVMQEFQRQVDRVCALIVGSGCPKMDIDVERAKVRQKAEGLSPDRMGLYDMIYESRFDRLWNQFREAED